MMLDYKPRPLPPVKKFIKKTKNKHIKQCLVKAIFHSIPTHPKDGSLKHGDLRGIWTWKVIIPHQQFRIAYVIDKNKWIIPILMAGPRENFYNKLRNYLRNSSRF